MKKIYEKPEAELVDFSIEESITVEDDDVIDGSMGTGGNFDF